MSSPLIKKQLIKKQLEDCLNDYKDLIKYLRSVLLWHRPIDLGILILSVSALLWYSRNFSLSVITSIFTAIPLYLFITIIAKQPILNLISMVQPKDISNEAYDEVINILTAAKYSVSEDINELYKLKQLSPIKFFIQISIVCAVIAFLGCYISGYTLFVIAGFISNKHHESIVAIVGPHIDNGIKLVSNTISQLTEKFINQPQPSPASNVNAAAQSAAKSSSSFKPSNVSRSSGDYSDISKKNS
ncbi:hypothetical protein PPL_07185 [Heterostelium album PN500]|uniref:RETREG1-3/ARL6IP-like N-terminal reticulon-homology domain-containing protein n=1 Tax=Heterostelium pallidum (strain ATCC 26659 / Pp 5 / PN500) TaxID=670386 RepID=D3BEM1_HETP5|nr:hypothetical protein PPL_07185 [Heterostelium album PN500]EFA80352.1 hypothetical protein PPL_07185 [Heterostelium album PN500]|eukprot:XP_020432472.1 hypothetical protein PPL_07185 [Heterostelium album PN500]